MLHFAFPRLRSERLVQHDSFDGAFPSWLPNALPQYAIKYRMLANCYRMLAGKYLWLAKQYRVLADEYRVLATKYRWLVNKYL